MKGLRSCCQISGFHGGGVCTHASSDNLSFHIDLFTVRDSKSYSYNAKLMTLKIRLSDINVSNIALASITLRTFVQKVLKLQDFTAVKMLIQNHRS